MISDVQLGAMSGLELVRRARPVPAVVISAATDPSIEGEGAPGGRRRLLPKTFFAERSA